MRTLGLRNNNEHLSLRFHTRKHTQQDEIVRLTEVKYLSSKRNVKETHYFASITIKRIRLKSDPRLIECFKKVPSTNSTTNALLISERLSNQRWRLFYEMAFLVGNSKLRKRGILSHAFFH